MSTSTRLSDYSGIIAWRAAEMLVGGLWNPALAGNTPELWRTVRERGRTYTEGYFLHALDLERSAEGRVQAREAAQVYVQLYTKTLRMALVITLLTLLLGYPLAATPAEAPPRIGNLLMVLVLLPFWTSLLVRTTAWIALLQTNGVINSVLMGAGVTKQPLEMLYTEFATILAMTHILLPMMILPLYSVMKGNYIQCYPKVLDGAGPRRVK